MTQNAGDGNARYGSDAAAQYAAAEDPASSGDSAVSGGESAAEGATEAVGPRDDATDLAVEIAALRAQATENWEKYLRAVAEMDNLRKRGQRDLENARKFGVERFASAILPVKDTIEAALAAASNEAVPVDVPTLLEGERATLRLLDQALEDAGVREIDPQGESFDPNLHEAMTIQPTNDVPPDSVAVVIQKGYQLNDRLLRPARVIVAAPVDGP